MRWRTPSIHPKHSASSTDCDQLRLGLWLWLGQGRAQTVVDLRAELKLLGELIDSVPQLLRASPDGAAAS